MVIVIKILLFLSSKITKNVNNLLILVKKMGTKYQP